MRTLTPFVSDPDFTLLVGDAVKCLRTLPAESVHCALTSPPFYALRDYGVDGQIGLERSARARGDRSVNVHDGTWRVPFYVTRVVDADTLEGDADLGWGVWKHKLHVRVDGLASPENSTEAGKAATAWAKTLLPAGTRLTLHSRWLLTFSRVVGSLYLPDGSDYRALVVAAGHGTVV